jgi:hypothetical protein
MRPIVPFAPSSANTRTPDMLTYSGNLVVNAVSHYAVVPYVTGGIGGLTMYDRPEFGITNPQTFLTGNVGGGLKWYAPNGHWGLRGGTIASWPCAPTTLRRRSSASRRSMVIASTAR